MLFALHENPHPLEITKGAAPPLVSGLVVAEKLPRSTRSVTGRPAREPEIITRSKYKSWIAAKLPGWDLTIGGVNHFTIMDKMADPDGQLTAAILRLCGISAASAPSSR